MTRLWNTCPNTFIRLAVLASEADKRHGMPPQGELLVVRDKVERTQGELGVSKSMECDIFRFSVLNCWLGDRKGMRVNKNWMLVFRGDDLTGALHDL